MKYLISSICMFSVILAAFMSSCSRRPHGVLSDNEMVSLIVDMDLADAYFEATPHTTDQRMGRNVLAEGVMASHGVTREELDSTWRWYGRNVDDYSKMLVLVDQRLEEKRRETLNNGGQMEGESEDGMIWPFPKNGQVSPLGTTDGWIFSLPNPELNEGDRLIWKLHVNQMHDASGVLGVEYTDGSSAATVSDFFRKTNIELMLPTDTGKTVKRIYGTMKLKDVQQKTVYADSISLNTLPFDSTEYSNSYSVRRYNLQGRKKNPETFIESDTLSSVPAISSEPYSGSNEIQPPETAISGELKPVPELPDKIIDNKQGEPAKSNSKGTTHIDPLKARKKRKAVSN